MHQAALQHDLILTSGGVSVGEEDHIKPAVQSLGELHLWSLAIKPGKPLAFGSVRNERPRPCLFVGLPGNPVSSFVTFLVDVAPLLRALSAVVAGTAAVAAFALPLKLNIVLAIGVAVLVCLSLEHRLRPAEGPR